MNKNMSIKAANLLENIRTKAPFVWNFSNFVSMDIAANALLAIGASPAMAHAKEEANDFSQICKAISGALTINIGTFDPYWQECAKEAAKQANDNNVPWVLDPVGAGASQFRNKNVEDLMKLNPTVLRGNGSEIMAVSGISGVGKGVDSTSSSNEALDAANSIAIENKIIVAVTGEIDYVTDGKQTYAISGGHEMMTKVTATGCALTCLIGAAIAIGEDKLLSTAAIIGIYGLAGEMASKVAKGPGSLRMHLLDNLTNLTKDEVLENINIQNV
ncbi:hydroxyethylthiazole kinase [Pseudomonadota bacterium]|jgi:hydroxyethylthiazole kinase|nr:hydroxyethylthiazole kinase [Pseudomonadota bacterium]